MNVAELLKVRAAIEAADPRRVDMTGWAYENEHGETVGCIGGWCCLVNGMVHASPRFRVSFFRAHGCSYERYFAEKKLDLSTDQSIELFYADLGDSCTPQHKQAVLDHIDRFIENYAQVAA